MFWPTFALHFALRAGATPFTHGPPAGYSAVYEAMAAKRSGDVEAEAAVPGEPLAPQSTVSG
jgi:hypothetical protein